jgi:hypothetical protein
MSTLTQLQQNRRVIQDLTTTTLAAIPRLFARLTYLASLRDLSSGRYAHAGLSAMYSEEAVQQALAQCHEEVFERILETPLEGQLEDLRACLEAMEGGLPVAVRQWQRLEAYRMLLTTESPEYLKDLFRSNVRVLLEMLEEECSRARSSG